MRLIKYTATAILLSTTAYAGGYELQTLDTSSLYSKGGYASISTAKFNSKLTGTGNDDVAVKTLRDQSFNNMAVKADMGPVSVGFQTYRSGAIQMSGGNNLAGNYAPKLNADIDSMALLVGYGINENISVLGGIVSNSLSDFDITAITGAYAIKKGSSTNYVVGAAYSIDEIALRAELLYERGTTLTTTGTYASALPITATVKKPDSVTLNFQTGIAADTLLTASIRNAKWSKANVVADVATKSAPIDLSSAFDDSTKYSIGIGRKFSDKISGSVSYSSEAGSGATSTSLFTISNGSKAISAGVKYSFDNMSLSVGASRHTFGDVTVDLDGAGTTYKPIEYKNNTATTIGVKLAFEF